MKLYLDQMFRVELAQSLRAAEYDVLRAAGRSGEKVTATKFG